MSEGFADGSPGRSLAGFTVELDVYSGPYEWLLALILKEEIEIFEVPLRALIRAYLDARPVAEAGAAVLDRDTDFAGSASALILLKSRALFPALESDPDGDDAATSPEELAERLARYLQVRRGAEALRDRLHANAGHHPSAHAPKPRPGRLRVSPDRLTAVARRLLSQPVEPPVGHLGPITVTVQELVDVIQTSLARGPVSFEELTAEMDRLRSAVAFSAALSLAHEGTLNLHQTQPLGPLTLKPAP